MHQQTYCHTLIPNPFSKFFYLEFMHQPYTALTLTSTRPASGFHTSPRQSSHHKPIHQRHSPPNLHVHTTHKPIQPTTTDAQTKPQIPHSTNTTIHTPQIPQPYSSTNTYSLHKHTQPHKHTRPLDASPPTDVDVDVDVDADDVPTLLQHRCSRSPIPVSNWTGQTDRIRLSQTRPD